MPWSRVGSVDSAARAALPDWLTPVAAAVERVGVDDITRFAPPDEGTARHSAVLILFSDDRDVLLIERAQAIRSHPGQPAFPGGGVEPEDADATMAALR